MKVFLICAFVCLNQFIAKTSANDLSRTDAVARDKKYTLHIDLVQGQLESESWSDEELPCYRSTLAIMNHARNSTLWATWMWDSMQLPVGVLYGSRYQLGNYDECLQPPWRSTHAELRAQYCLADVHVTGRTPHEAGGGFDPYTSAESYINTLGRHGRVFNTVTWGVCLPAQCGRHAVSKFVRALLRTSHLGPLAADAAIAVDQCQVAGVPEQYSIGFWCFWMLLPSLFVIALLSTWYVDLKKSTHDSSIVTNVARAFCMKRNWYDLVKEGKDEIQSLHGIRLITSYLMTYAHQAYFVNSHAHIYGLDADKSIDSYMYLPAWILTDSYLVMSGLLHVRSLLARRDNPESPWLVLLKRYVRLIGVFALMMWYVGWAAPRAGAGPLWERRARSEQRMCRDNYWLGLLMLANYVNTDRICYIVSWYIQCDFQLTVLGTALVCWCCRHRRSGQAVVLATAALAVILPFYTTYSNNMPATLYFDVPLMENTRKMKHFTHSFVRTHLRMTAYVIGMGMGYFMAVYNPSQYIKTISKIWSSLGFILAIAITVRGVRWCGDLYFQEYSALQSAIFAATYSVLWGLILSFIIALCEYGTLPYFGSFVKWRALVPLSRLTYGLYLVHPALMQAALFAARTPQREDLLTLISSTCGAIVLGTILSLFAWLLLQAPLVNLTNLMLPKATVKPKPKVPNGCEGNCWDHGKKIW